MIFRIAADFDVKVVAVALADELDQFVGVGEFAGGPVHALGQVTAQGDDAIHPRRLVVVEELADALARALDAGQMGGRRDTGGLHAALDRLEGARARGAAGAEGHREEGRAQFGRRASSSRAALRALGRKESMLRNSGMRSS